MRRLRAKVRDLPSGTPWATVRSNYVGLPSMAGRGPDERRRKPPGSGGAKPRPDPEARSRRCEIAAAVRREARACFGLLLARTVQACPRHALRRKALTDFGAPRGAPLPHVSRDKRIRAHSAPAKEYGR